MIVCIEGLTNSGKTSLCKALNKNADYIFVNDKMKGNIVSENIKKITNPLENLGKFDYRTELLLYCSMLSEKASIINMTGGNLIVDRFTLSVYAYFKARYNVDDEVLKQIVDFSSKKVIPDITFFVDVPLNVILERTVESPFSRKDVGIEEYYLAIRECYLKTIDRFSKKSYVLDGAKKSIEDIANEVNSIMKGMD